MFLVCWPFPHATLPKQKDQLCPCKGPLSISTRMKLFPLSVIINASFKYPDDDCIKQKGSWVYLSPLQDSWASETAKWMTSWISRFVLDLVLNPHHAVRNFFWSSSVYTSSSGFYWPLSERGHMGSIWEWNMASPMYTVSHCFFPHLNFNRLHPVLQSVHSDVLGQQHRVTRGDDTWGEAHCTWRNKHF